MAHKHGINCLEVRSGKIYCLALQRDVKRQGPRPSSGYAELYLGEETDFDRVRLTDGGDDWETVMFPEDERKGAKHLGLMNFSTGFGRRQMDVWKSKSEKFYAQIPRGQR